LFREAVHVAEAGTRLEDSGGPNVRIEERTEYEGRGLLRCGLRPKRTLSLSFSSTAFTTRLYRFPL
jgi:hypothetical protein